MNGGTYLGVNGGPGDDIIAIPGPTNAGLADCGPGTDSITVHGYKGDTDQMRFALSAVGHCEVIHFVGGGGPNPYGG